MLRWIGWGLAGLLGLAVLLLVLLGAPFGLAQTEFGQRRIAALVESQLEGPDTRAEIGGLGGLLPFDIRLERLTLADAEGAWLALEDARFAWSPRELLLGGRLYIDEISAAHLDLRRLPATRDDEEEEDEPDDEPIAVPELPDFLTPVIVGRLAVERIDLGEPVLGQAAAFSLHGRMATAEDGIGIAAELAAERLDEPTAWAALDAELTLAPTRALTLDLEVEETGGLLADITNRPSAGAFRLNLGGTGPLASWQGQLGAIGENLLRLDAGLALSLNGEPTLAVEGRLEPRLALISAEFARVLGDAVAFGLTVARTGDQQLALRDIWAANELVRLDGRAQLDLDAPQRVEASAAVRADALEPLSGLLDTPLGGGPVVLGVSAQGPLAQPTVRLDLRADDLAVPPTATVGRIAAGLQLLPLDPEASGWSGVRVTGDGALADLELTDGPPLPERDLRWELAGIVPAEGPIAIERLVLSGETLQLTAAGTVDPDALAGRAELRLEATDLAPLAALADQPGIGGAATLTADVTVAEATERVTVALDGQLLRLAGLPPGAADLLAPEVAFSAAAEFRPDELLRISEIEIDGAAATLTGGVTLALRGDRALDGELRLALPRLAALEPILGEPIQGELVLLATLDGTTIAPEAYLNAAGSDVAYAGQAVDALTARLSVLGLPDDPLHGALNLTAERAEQRLTADATYRLEDETLSLADLTLAAPGARLGGALIARLDDPPLVEGELSGTVDDPAALTGLFGDPAALAGRVDFALALQAADGRQQVALTAAVADLAGDFGRIAALDLQAEMADAFAASPGVEASAELRSFQSGETALERASVQVAGELDTLDATVAAVGEQGALPFDLNGAARISQDNGAVAIRLSRIDGRVDGQPVDLLRPATLTLADETARVQNLELRFATARLRAEASYGPDEVALEAELASLPLDLLAAFGVEDLAGTADARLTLAGSVANPAATLTVNASGLRVDDPAFEAVPTAALALRAELADRRLNANLSVERLTETPITARVAAPVVLTIEPFAFELPEDGALAGEVNAETRLERLVEYLALDDQRVAGLLRADLALGGTVGAPDLAGEITLANGRYEYGFTGTLLRDIRLRATGSERRIVISELSASDGGRGRITGSGAVSLDSARSFPFELTLNLNRATLLRRDFAEATVSGGMELSGTTAEARVAGTLTVNEAEFSLGGEFDGGPDVAVIDVVDILPDDAEDGVAEPLPNAEQDPPLIIALNLRIDAPGRVFVRGRGLESEWQGQLRVRGTVEDPQLVGTLSLRRGEFAFLDRRFDLREGEIEFTGDVPPVPTLDFAAAAEAEGFTAIIRVSGPATDPRIELDSEPALPEDEILSRLLFNRQLAEIGPAQAAQLAAAVARLRGGGGPDLLGRIRNVLDLDTLRIGTADGPDGATTVEVGRYLSDDVYIGVERGAGEATGRATVEIEVLPNVTLEAEVREDARAGVGVQWRFDY